jgi:hypothetical protein
MSTARRYDGFWNVATATLPDGKPAYTGSVTVQQHGHTPLLFWDTSAGMYVGIGLEAGAHLFVACGEHFAGLGLGIMRSSDTEAHFQLQWTSLELDGNIGAGRVMRLTEAGDEDLAAGYAGQYQWTQRLPNGKLLADFWLLIEAAGPRYNIVLFKNKHVHTVGMGLPFDGGLALAWYPDPAQLAFMDYQFAHPDELIAEWALGGFEALGYERLTREAR